MKVKSQFVKSLAVLTSGSILAQVLTVLCAPIMTRLYSPEQIGEYTLVLTAVGLFGSVICARYDMAIVAEENEKNVVSLCALSLLLTVTLSIVVSVGYAFYYTIKGYAAVQILFSCVCILILLVLQGINNIFLSYNNRCREYKLMTSVNLIRAAAKESVRIAGGLIHPVSWILVLSEIVGTIFGVTRQSRSLAQNTDRFRLLFAANSKDLGVVAKKHKKQALFSTPALFANNFSYSSINLFIDALFGTAALGYYSVSYRLLGMPLTLISANASKVFFEAASRALETEGNYYQLFKKTALLMLVFAVPMTIALMLFSPWFCSLFFGSDYYIAGIYLRYLAPMFGVRFIISPLSIGMVVSGKQQYELIFQSVFVLMSIVAFAISKILELAIEEYLLALSCLYTVVYIVFFFLLCFFSKQKSNC